MNFTKTSKRIATLLLSSSTVLSLSGNMAAYAQEIQEYNDYSFSEEATSSYSNLLIKDKRDVATDQLLPESNFTMEADILITGGTYKSQIQNLLNDLTKSIKDEISKNYAKVTGLEEITGTIEYEIQSSHSIKDFSEFTIESNIAGIVEKTSIAPRAEDDKTFTVTVDVKWGKLINTKFKEGDNVDKFSLYNYPDLSLKLKTNSVSFDDPLPKLNRDTVTFTGRLKTCTLSAAQNSITISYFGPDNPDKVFPDYIAADAPITNTSPFNANVLNASTKTSQVKIVEKITNQNKPTTPERPTTPTIPTGPQTVMRLYNPNTGEHLFTTSEAERINLASLGWNVEGNDWSVPATSDYPIYRVYNPNNGDHHYTTSADEVSALVSYGWISEGTKLYSLTAEDDHNIAIYRMYNPNANGAGSHHYTSSEAECAALQAKGWNFEGLAWYGLKQ